MKILQLLFLLHRATVHIISLLKYSPSLGPFLKLIDIYRGVTCNFSSEKAVFVLVFS